MKYGIIAKSLGALLLILAVGGLAPLGVDWILGSAIRPWLTMEALIIGAGLLLLILGRGADPDDMGLREGITTTSLVWLSGSLFAGIGIWLAAPGTGFVDGWFEAMSGFTTTGASIFGGDRPIERLSPGVLLWRSQTQWIGGIGIVVISLALLPLLVGGGGIKAFHSEVPGIDTDRLAPRIRDTAFILYRFYLTLTLVVLLGLLACGVGGFDAVCHAMTTVSTGGFSTFDNSVEGLNSAAAEWVIIAGMLVAGCNFGLLLHAIHGRPGRLLRSSEFRLYLALLIGASIALTVIIAAGLPEYDGRWHDRIRDAVFQAVAITTTTGYATGYDSIPASWEHWPVVAKLILVFLMIGGGCAGSTAGGMKLVRFLVAFRASRRELRRYAEPARVTPVKLGGHELKEGMILQVSAFLFVYFLTWVIGVLVLAALGSDMVTACTASLSCLSNIGPGLGDIGPSENWAGLSTTAHLVCIALMMFGRLELLGVILLLRLQHWHR